MTISIADDNGTGWAHLRILMAAGSKWTTLVDGGESTDTYHVEIRENCSIYVSVTDLAGNVHAKKHKHHLFRHRSAACQRRHQRRYALH